MDYSDLPKETKKYIIYEIIGRKVGMTCQLQNGMKRVFEQLQPLECYRVIRTIEPNTMTHREIWELEQQIAQLLGYSVEEERRYSFLYEQRFGRHLVK